jgi:isopentenyl-diphosphate Delta-isomerase
MPVKADSDTSRRKQEHINLCLNEDVGFKEKTNGFDKYEFIHDPITEVNISRLKFKTNFLKKNIDFPFLISCMTGGTAKAGNINTCLSIAANELKIALGVGSQRQALENNKYHKTYKAIRKNAPDIPILGNIGASQIISLESFKPVSYLIDLIEADAMVVHLNPAHELFQRKSQPNFRGLVRKIRELVKEIKIPIIVKEVGSGISGSAAKVLLNTGVYGIDVAGAGGTSWTGVEMLRNNEKNKKEFWDWGIPTSFCIKEVYKLKKNFNFVLIGSGGINNSFDMAKAYALGADITASARRILIELDKNGTGGVIRLIRNWFEDLKKIMFLTGSNSLIGLRKNKLTRKENIY